MRVSLTRAQWLALAEAATRGIGLLQPGISEAALQQAQRAGEAIQVITNELERTEE